MISCLRRGVLLCCALCLLSILGHRSFLSDPELPEEAAQLALLDLESESGAAAGASINFLQTVGKMTRSGVDVQDLMRPFEDFMPGSLAEWRQEDWPLVNMSLLSSSSRRACGVEGCDQASVAPASSGPNRTYVFVMGVEGAGHHALCPLLRSLLEQSGHEVHVSPINMFGREQILPFGQWKADFLAEMKTWCPSGVCINCLDSFPYARPIKASAAPDFPRMAALHEEGLIDLRVVSILRNLPDSVFSALRRFPSDPVQAIASTRQFLMEVVRNTDAWSKLHCERLSTLRYETLVKDAKDVVPGLARALGLEQRQGEGEHLSQAMSVAEVYQRDNVHGNHAEQYRDEDPALYDKVSSWLKEREEFLWPELKELWCT